MYFCGQNGDVKYPAPVILDGKPLPWVDHAVHLGHVLHQSISMEKDCHRARAGFIDRSVDIREQFSFAQPDQIVKIFLLLGGKSPTNIFS